MPIRKLAELVLNHLLLHPKDDRGCRTHSSSGTPALPSCFLRRCRGPPFIYPLSKAHKNLSSSDVLASSCRKEQDAITVTSGLQRGGRGNHLGPGTRSPALLQPSDLCTARLPSELSYDFFFQQCQVHWCCQSRLVLPTCENWAGCRLVL